MTNWRAQAWKGAFYLTSESRYKAKDFLVSAAFLIPSCSPEYPIYFNVFPLYLNNCFPTLLKKKTPDLLRKGMPLQKLPEYTSILFHVIFPLSGACLYSSLLPCPRIVTEIRLPVPVYSSLGDALEQTRCEALRYLFLLSGEDLLSLSQKNGPMLSANTFSLLQIDALDPSSAKHFSICFAV